METHKTKRNLNSSNLIKNYIERGYYDLAASLINKVKNPAVKRKLTAILTASMIATTSAPAMPIYAANLTNNQTTISSNGMLKNFSDVPTNFWAYESIYKLVNTGGIKGYPDNTFKPNNTITRAEFTSMLINTLKLEIDDKETGYVDVPESHWANDIIATAREEGILYEDGSNKFNPSIPIQRQDVAVMVSNSIENYCNEDCRDLNKVFADERSFAQYAKDSIESVTNYGIVGGYPDGTFGPSKPITRAEAAKIIVGLRDLLLKQNEPVVSDFFSDENAENWRYVISEVELPCDGVNRVLAFINSGEHTTLLPLEGDEEWSNWGNDFIETKYNEEGRLIILAENRPDEYWGTAYRAKINPVYDIVYVYQERINIDEKEINSISNATEGNTNTVTLDETNYVDEKSLKLEF